jgi:hypothetical protein
MFCIIVYSFHVCKEGGRKRTRVGGGGSVGQLKNDYVLNRRSSRSKPAFFVEKQQVVGRGMFEDGGGEGV